MPDIQPVLDHLDAGLDAALARLLALVRIPSISTDPAYAGDCRRAAEALVADLGGIGFEARVAATEGHPMVVGHDHAAGRGTPHVLFYGHYDVQPVDPLELWEADPFAPALNTRADGTKYISGRGAADDKGQLMTFVEACRAWRAVHGSLPCRVTVLLEGEEESGGKSLPPFMEAHRAELAADIALVCDTGMWDRATPAITTMLRGNLTEEVIVHAASRDLHSGMYGGPAANPIRVLAAALAALHDADGRVAIPGFYAGVPELADAIRAQWDGLGFDAGAFLGEVGLAVPAGERDRTALETIWSRPTCEFNGIVGGYTGEGFKTVIPARASAKISCRLVGSQDPDAVREGLRAFIAGRMPADCRAEFVSHGSGRATAMPTDAPAFAAAQRALSREWGREAAFIGCGGSIPVVADFKRILGLDTLLIGFGLDDDRIHSPNEKYELASFHRGARSWARVLSALAG